MKAFKVVYKHGHFIDVETGLRLIPVQDAIYTISASDNAFKTEDAKLRKGIVLNTELKAKWIDSKYGKSKYAKILNAGEQLFFRVGNSKPIQGDESSQYIFLCTLLEDLYIYFVKGRKTNDIEDWRLAECQCELEKCLVGGLTLTEKISSKSLNALFSNTVQFYFTNQRSTAANAFDTFFLYKKDIKNISFEGAINKRYRGLQDLRKDYVLERNKQSGLFSK